MILTQQQCLTKSTGGRDWAVFIFIIVKYVNDRSQQQYKILTLKFFTTLSIYRYSKQFESSCEWKPRTFFSPEVSISYPYTFLYPDLTFYTYGYIIYSCSVSVPFIHNDILLFCFSAGYFCYVSVPVIHMYVCIHYTYIFVLFQCRLYIQYCIYIYRYLYCCYVSVPVMHTVQYICIYIVVLFQCRCCACLSPMWARWARKGARWRLTRPSGRTTVPSAATGSAPPAHPTFPSRWYIYSFTFILVNPIIIVMFHFIFNCFGANPPPLFDVTESEKINNLFS